MTLIRDLIPCLPMLALLVWAAVVDVRSRRIPNWLTLSLIATGLFRAAMPDAPVGLGQGLAGMGAGFGLTFILFALGAMGGGDVKMFAGIGAWVGTGRVVEIFAAAALAGMVIVIWQAARGGRLASLARGSALIVVNATVTGDLTCPDKPGEANSDQEQGGKQKPLPYAVPTLVAALLVLCSGRRWL
jgi:prepilin peptidase CpaA